jgi:hypothetical protein
MRCSRWRGGEDGEVANTMVPTFRRGNPGEGRSWTRMSASGWRGAPVG